MDKRMTFAINEARRLAMQCLAGIVLCLLLVGCSGGVSGLMSSSPPGYWQIYRITYQPGQSRELKQPAERALEDIFFRLGFEQKQDWGRPLLADARVSGFKRTSQGRDIYIKVQVSDDVTLIMSTSYSRVTSTVFDRLEKALKETFGVASIESCYGMKDIEGRTCLDD